MVSALCLSLLVAPGLAFVRTPFVAEQVRHAPAQTARSATSARTSTRMVATPDKVNTGVKRNENFAKLKVGDLVLVRGQVVCGWSLGLKIKGWCSMCNPRVRERERERDRVCMFEKEVHRSRERKKRG